MCIYICKILRQQANYKYTMWENYTLLQNYAKLVGGGKLAKSLDSILIMRNMYTSFFSFEVLYWLGFFNNSCPINKQWKYDYYSY